MTNELVPFDCVRSAYNTLHGTDLEAHNDLLTREQAARINQHYDLQVYVGTHARGYNPKTDDLEQFRLTPTPLEYAEVEAVVNTLQVGDALFVEAYGYAAQPIELYAHDVSWRHNLGMETVDPNRSSLLGVIGQNIFAGRGRRLEQSRQRFEISAWRYAAELALLKGIQVVYADHDAFDEAAFKALYNGRSSSEVRYGVDPTDRAIIDDTDMSRERRARNIVKDWALRHLPPEQDDLESGRKPKLALLFGSAHEDGLRAAYDDAKLQAEFITLRSSDLDVRKRHAEKIQFLAAAMMSQVMKLSANVLSDTIGSSILDGMDGRR